MDIEVENILKVLAHPARVQFLRWLKEPEQYFADQEHPLSMGVCAGQFEKSGLSQSTVSAHLASLSCCGLVTAHRIGQWVFYKRNENAIRSFLEKLSRELTD